MIGRRHILVVDGYNAIRCSSRYSALIDEDLHDVYMRARTALIADVAAFAQGSYEATVVFDGFNNPEPDRIPTRSAGINVIFSPSGVEADSVIERLVTQYREEGCDVTVVTSDSNVQSTVYGDGVTRLSSRMFDNEASEINERLETMRRAPNTGGPSHATVADRLSPDIRAALKEMTLPDKERRHHGTGNG